MTGPVARAVSPRRTVRVAVALVAGQAVLCAVIGWVTFGPSEAAKPDAAGVHPSTKPIILPDVPRLVGPTPAEASKPAETSSPRTSRSTRPATTRATSEPADEKAQPNIALPDLADSPPPPPPPPSASPGTALSSPSPPSPAPVQSPVVKDRPCDPEGARGRTSDAVELRCVRDDDGDLVWQIN